MPENFTTTLIQAEDTPIRYAADTAVPPITGDAFDETSLRHFCTFIDFYTRQCHDPFSTSLTCAKQAEALQITPEDLTPESMRQVVATMLAVVDHLEKKWLDEQIRHEERMQRHRQDVARLSQQLRTIQHAPPVKTPVFQRGLAWIHQMLGGRKKIVLRQTPRKHGVKHREALAA